MEMPSHINMKLAQENVFHYTSENVRKCGAYCLKNPFATDKRIYMLFAGWEVRKVKNCDRGLENAAQNVEDKRPNNVQQLNKGS